MSDAKVRSRRRTNKEIAEVNELNMKKDEIYSKYITGELVEVDSKTDDPSNVAVLGGECQTSFENCHVTIYQKTDYSKPKVLLKWLKETYEEHFSGNDAEMDKVINKYIKDLKNIYKN